MVTDVKPVQLANALVLMLITFSGIVMEVRFVQPINASPMLVTLSGMIVFEQPAISVLDAVSIIALQSLRES